MKKTKRCDHCDKALATLLVEEKTGVIVAEVCGRCAKRFFDIKKYSVGKVK